MTPPDDFPLKGEDLVEGRWYWAKDHRVPAPWPAYYRNGDYGLALYRYGIAEICFGTAEDYSKPGWAFCEVNSDGRPLAQVVHHSALREGEWYRPANNKDGQAFCFRAGCGHLELLALYDTPETTAVSRMMYGPRGHLGELNDNIYHRVPPSQLGFDSVMHIFYDKRWKPPENSDIAEPDCEPDCDTCQDEGTVIDVLTSADLVCPDCGGEGSLFRPDCAGPEEELDQFKESLEEYHRIWRQVIMGADATPMEPNGYAAWRTSIRPITFNVAPTPTQQETDMNDNETPGKSTSDLIKQSMKRGGQLAAIGATQRRAQRKLEEALGEHYPELLKTDMGRKIVELALPAMVLYACDFDEADRIPGKDAVRVGAQLALVEASRDGAADIIELLMELLLPVAGDVTHEFKKLGESVDAEELRSRTASPVKEVVR